MYSNRSMPQAQIIPELTYPDVNAAALWLTEAFGFSVRLRIGTHRVQLELGTGAVILREGAAPGAEATASHAVMVRVDSADEHYARAVSAGARVAGAPTTHPYGERQYAAQDLAGHWWVFSQSVEDVHPSQWGAELASD
jgi:uncharacterized glyoxalase superfamily protein PhnB